MKPERGMYLTANVQRGVNDVELPPQSRKEHALFVLLNRDRYADSPEEIAAAEKLLGHTVIPVDFQDSEWQVGVKQGQPTSPELPQTQEAGNGVP